MGVLGRQILDKHFVRLEGRGIYEHASIIIHKRPQSGTHDGLEWVSASFSVQGTYAKIREGQYENQSITRAVGSSRDERFH